MKSSDYFKALESGEASAFDKWVGDSEEKAKKIFQDLRSLRRIQETERVWNEIKRMPILEVMREKTRFFRTQGKDYFKEMIPSPVRSGDKEGIKETGMVGEIGEFRIRENGIIRYTPSSEIREITVWRNDEIFWESKNQEGVDLDLAAGEYIFEYQRGKKIAVRIPGEEES